ncbi:hypothetical protein [Bacillus sp. X1(2014)]|uniref:hypothetical protein n=1 Tax=Bacillus sp. X1(2014) TaxID=1565991 RepID=UPI00164352D8|nr:hypothetical protein [Bacillus sp. X1(2014)]
MIFEIYYRDDQTPPEDLKKMVFIMTMMTKSLRKNKESGLHYGDDDQFPPENQR